ncbi:MAG: pyruvate formate-lyase-activating protein [Firmicutes bacterium]|nr:pyruvate formate-lyase-activating protein [Bacillota bacterium]
MQGRIHSFESMGLHDGPGIRSVVFLKGCPLRCSYCHNPDTWVETDGDKISSDELLNKVKRFAHYHKSSGGGVTVSGGEPLLQGKFLKDFFKKCKDEGIHTALDTSGVGLKEKYNELLDYTDLIILDIKHWNPDGYLDITGISMDAFNDFINTIKVKYKGDIWIRHVVVPGISDDKKSIEELEKYINDLGLRNVKKLELLPFHNMAKEKYDKLNIDYTFKDVKALEYDYVNSLLG